MAHEKLSVDEIVEKLKERAEDIRKLADLGLFSKQEMHVLKIFGILKK